MNADSIARLSRKLLATSLAEDGEVLLASQTYRKELARLPSPVGDPAIHFVEEVRAAIPSDFSFVLIFTPQGVALHVELEDGNTGGTAARFKFTSHKSLRRSLRSYPWDECRKELLKKFAIFDEMKSAAEDRPANIPSSEEAATAHAAELEDALADFAEDGPKSAFAVVGYREEGVEIVPADSRDQMRARVGDLMTTQYHILAILENGTKWGFDAIEATKLEAVEDLGPISRAKAEGRFFA